MAGTSLSPNPPANVTPAKRSVASLIFRIIRWATYAAAILTLIMVFHAVPAPTIATSPQAAARVEQKMQDVDQAVAAGQSATLRLDQTELNSYLASHLEVSRGSASPNKATDTPATSPATLPEAAPPGTPAEQVAQVRSTVKDVKVQLIADRVRAYVVFDFHGKDMTLQLEGKLAAENGYLRFQPIAGQIGSLSIPQSALESAMQKLVASPENREKLKLPSEMSDLKIENGEVVATYR